MGTPSGPSGPAAGLGSSFPNLESAERGRGADPAPPFRVSASTPVVVKAASPATIPIVARLLGRDRFTIESSKGTRLSARPLASYRS
jgi:hypothetical protein